MHPYAHCSVIYNGQDVEAAQVPSVEERIKQQWYIYAGECYCAMKRGKILPFVTTRMDLEGVVRCEISQTKETNAL